MRRGSSRHRCRAVASARQVPWRRCRPAGSSWRSTASRSPRMSGATRRHSLTSCWCTGGRAWACAGKTGRAAFSPMDGPPWPSTSPGTGMAEARCARCPISPRTVSAIGRHYGDAEGVVAHSLGGAAVTLALDDGWTAKRVVLIAPAADPQAATQRFARFVRLGEHLRPALHDVLAERTGVRIDDLHIRHHAPKRAQPLLVVHDVSDRDVPVDEGELYASIWPGARLLSDRSPGPSPGGGR